MNKVVSEFLSRQVFEQRVLIVSPANDTAAHFISLMNSAFTLQKLGMTLDACLLNQPIDSSHLQQACEITRGVYTRPKHPMGLINYLLGVHILDSTARSNFEMPQNRAIDYKATCFCHSKAVDLGFICSACLAGTLTGCIGRFVTASNIAMIR
jgi:transcription initiation factor TFIIH subunit 3